jgi:hypothetical protein
VQEKVNAPLEKSVNANKPVTRQRASKKIVATETEAIGSCQGVKSAVPLLLNVY